MIEGLQEWQKESGAGGGGGAASLASLRERLSAAKAAVAAHHKEVSAAATKLCKAADKQLGAGPSLSAAAPLVQLETQLLNAAVHTHLLVGGRFELAATFAREAGLDAEESAPLVASLRQMHAVRDELLEGGDLDIVGLAVLARLR